MIFSMRTGDEKTTMQGSINELQLFSCSYNPEKRNETKCPVSVKAYMLLNIFINSLFIQ